MIPRETYDDSEILATVQEMLHVLAQPDPDPELFRILESKPLSTMYVTKLIGATAVAAAGMTLKASPVPRADVTAVHVGYNAHPDDIPGWQKDSADLIALACDFLLTSDDDGQAQALQAACLTLAQRDPQYALLALADLLAHMRRLLEGDTRGVVTRDPDT